MSPRVITSARSTLVADAALMQRVAQGDVAALGTLYDRYAPTLFAFAQRIDRNDADDIVQTVFLRVMRLATRFDPESVSARPWLYAITTRVMQERRRSLRRGAAALMRMSMRSTRPVADSHLDTRRDMERGLAQLSVAKRTVLVLAEVEGFSGEEIADMLGIPVGTVWTRLHHARQDMRAFHLGDAP